MWGKRKMIRCSSCRICWFIWHRSSWRKRRIKSSRERRLILLSGTSRFWSKRRMTKRRKKRNRQRRMPWKRVFWIFCRNLMILRKRILSPRNWKWFRQAKHGRQASTAVWSCHTARMTECAHLLLWKQCWKRDRPIGQHAVFW